jgi:hypothetical protein
MTLRALDLAIEARLGQVDLEVLGRPTVRLLQRDVNLMAVIRTTDRAFRALMESPEHLVENVVHVGARTTLWSLGASKLVEVLALLGIGQDVVGALDLLELFSIPGWFVRVMLKGEFSVRLLYLIIRGSPPDP